MMGHPHSCPQSQIGAAVGSLFAQEITFKGPAAPQGE